MFSRREFLKIGAAALGMSALRGGREQGVAELPAVPTIWHGSSLHRSIALTYDDCYLLRRMLDLEELLAAFPEFKVTLFPVGVALLSLEDQDPGIWRRFHDSGHEIGYHSWDHGGIHVMSATNALADFDRWTGALTQLLGFQAEVRFARPPYGVLSPAFDAIARERGQVVAMWSTGWGGELAVGLKASESTRNGDIVLLHIRTQDFNTSREAFPWLRENGWAATTLSILYDTLLREQYQSEGCDVQGGPALVRTCIE
jgi:peptidoglycan/xylan/chitin deacetylase (PgdA/CDA1 family)